MLGLEKKSYAADIAIRIQSWVWTCEEEEAARAVIPDIKVERKRLERIATTAAILARLLEDEPLAEELMREPGAMSDRQDAMEDGVLDMTKLHDIDQRKLMVFIQTAKQVRRNAEFALSDDRRLRLHLGLPKRENAGKSPITSRLWPNLFQTWTWAGKRVAKTNGGPLHRFVAFVHSVYDLGEVKASTLKDSIAEWQQDGWWQNMQPDPPWRDAEED